MNDKFTALAELLGGALTFIAGIAVVGYALAKAAVSGDPAALVLWNIVLIGLSFLGVLIVVLLVGFFAIRYQNSLNKGRENELRMAYKAHQIQSENYSKQLEFQQRLLLGSGEVTRPMQTKEDQITIDANNSVFADLID